VKAVVYSTCNPPESRREGLLRKLKQRGNYKLLACEDVVKAKREKIFEFPRCEKTARVFGVWREVR
jgi:hypothetical protein